MKVESLGRPAHFFIPAHKWHNFPNGKYVSDRVHDFLMANYGGYTLRGPFKGNWRPQQGAYPIVESVMEIKVAFEGKERIPELQKFLADLCALINEECLYLETGEDSFLIYP